MTRPRMTVVEGSKLLDRSLNRQIAQLALENQAENFARGFWKLLVRKAGEPRARAIMRRAMGEDKPGRPSKPIDDVLNLILPGYIIKYAHESDEKIAIRISDGKQHYVRYKSGRFGLVDGKPAVSTKGLVLGFGIAVEGAMLGISDLIVATADANDPIVDCKPIGPAEYIFKSPDADRSKTKRYRVRFRSGVIAQMNGESLARLNDPIVECEPIAKSTMALKKRIQRIRRQMIEDGSLPKKYAPKEYHPS